MILQELVKLESHRVRNDNILMAFYLEYFEKQFGRLPNCAGCTFKNDWNRLVNAVQTNQKTITMKTDKTFQLKSTSKIYTYTENKRPVRTYGYKMTEEFAKNFLTKGSAKEIEERKKLFKVLPATEKTIELGGEKVNLKDATGKQMDAYAKDHEIDFGDATKVAEKREVISKTL